MEPQTKLYSPRRTFETAVPRRINTSPAYPSHGCLKVSLNSVNDNVIPAVPNRQAWDAWRAQIQAIGVTNPLLNYEFDGFSQIDLERAHPGGFAQFIGAGSGLLFNLVRDPLAYSRALSAAKRIDAKTHQLSEHFGIETCFMVGGLVSLEADGFDLKMPILMWPVQLIRKADDYEILIAGTAKVNPALATSLEICYGVKLNPQDLLNLLGSQGDLVPIAVMDYLSNLVGAAGSLDSKRILAIGNFTTVPTEMLADITSIDVPLLNRIADGDQGAELRPLSAQAILSVVAADETQKRVVARALEGQSFAVETLPGCGYTQTVVNLLANLAFDNRKVLVLSPRRQTLDEVASRFAALGLNGLLTRSHEAWLDVIGAISRHEKAVPAAEGRVAAELRSVTAQIEGYFAGLESKDPVLDVSVIEVLTKLAELSAMPHAPVTNARIDRTQLLAKPDRQAALDLLMQAEKLGEFKFGPQDSAWYQARFESPDQVEQAIATAKRLRDETYPHLASKLTGFIAAVQFKPANSVAEFGIYLKLFAGIRESLDKFVPGVFDRSLSEVIIATADRKLKSEMSGGTRRKLKKLAKEFVRPGMHVSDMNASLRAIEDQRETWMRLSESLKPPTVPAGINDALVTYQALVDDLDKLQRHLDPKNDEPALVDLELAKLTAKLNSLVQDTGALENLSERAMVANQLRASGLEGLMRDLGRLHVKHEHIAVEFDLAWWQTTLEYLVEKNPGLLTANPRELERTEQKFRDLQAAQLAQNRDSIVAKLATDWQQGLVGFPDQANRLKALLKTGSAGIPQLVQASPHLLSAFAPILAISPYEVAASLPNAQFDVVILLDSAGTSIAENLSGLKRAKQVIAFGDNVIAYPTGFEVEARPIPIGREEKVSSALTAVSNAFGAEVLRNNYRGNGQLLGDFINSEFYQNRIHFEPTLDDYFDVNHLMVEYIKNGNRASTNIDGACESLDAELEKTVELIFRHAANNPEESLLVATASPVHAERLKNAVRVGLHQRRDVIAFFTAHGSEKFEVSSISSLAHRSADHIIFSIGFGKTPKGAMLSNLGDLSGIDGRRAFVNLLVSARKRLTVVSCFTESDIADETAGGVPHLRQLLANSARVEIAKGLPESDLNDPMLRDLALRLRKLGVTVRVGFGEHLSLVASYGNRAIVLIPDWQINSRDLAREIWLRSNLLTQLGWTKQRVFAFELFSNPEKYARDLAEALGLSVYNKPQMLFEDEVPFKDSDEAWGDKPGMSNDQRLQADKPPHWG